MIGVHAVIHLAADLSFDPDPHKIVTPTVDSVRSILRSAGRAGSVKRFVFTSSTAAVLMPKANEEVTVGINDWDQEAAEEAWKPPPYTPDRAFFTYGASKVAAEQALWSFMKEEKPGFIANAILPGFNAGQILTSGGPTGSLIGTLLEGQVPPVPPQYHINVIDNARIHLIAAVLDPTFVSQRIFATARPFNFTEMIEILRELRPDASGLALPPENEGHDLSKLPNEHGRRLLKQWYGQEDYKTLRESVEECLASMKL